MKHLRADAEAAVAASEEECFALLADVESYARWHPQAICQMEVIERDGDGRASRIAATLRAEAGPIAREFHLLLALVLEPPRVVKLTRIPHEPADPERFEVSWRIAPGPPTGIQLEFEAALDVPRLLPIGTVGDSLATGFVDAAARELSSRPGSGSPL